MTIAYIPIWIGSLIAGWLHWRWWLVVPPVFFAALIGLSLRWSASVPAARAATQESIRQHWGAMAIHVVEHSVIAWILFAAAWFAVSLLGHK